MDQRSCHDREECPSHSSGTSSDTWLCTLKKTELLQIHKGVSIHPHAVDSLQLLKTLNTLDYSLNKHSSLRCGEHFIVQLFMSLL